MDANITSSQLVIGRRHGYISSVSQFSKDTVEPGLSQDHAAEVQSTVRSRTDAETTSNNLELDNPSECIPINRPHTNLHHVALDPVNQIHPDGASTPLNPRTLLDQTINETEAHNVGVLVKTQRRLKPCFLLLTFGVAAILVAVFMGLYWSFARSDPRTGFTIMTGILMIVMAVTLLTVIAYQTCQCFPQAKVDSSRSIV